MTVAIRQFGDEIRAVLVICHSPALTNGKSAARAIRGYFSEKMQYAIEKRFDFYFHVIGGRGLSITAPSREPKYPPLAEPACRCSYPNQGAPPPGPLS
jgi:hypothetical protein